MRPLWGAVTVSTRQGDAIDDLTEETKKVSGFYPTQPKQNICERLLDKFPLLGGANEPDEILCNIE